jgi:hypothetical protein
MTVPTAIMSIDLLLQHHEQEFREDFQDGSAKGN